MAKPEECRLNPIEQEQIAAQMVSIMDAHLKRPQPDEKQYILALAVSQVNAQRVLPVDEVESPGVAQITPNNRHGETNWGDRRGNEVW